MKRFLLGSAIAIGSMMVALPAVAAPQTVDATIGSTLSMTSSPTASVSGWALAATGANSTSGGSVATNTNQPYILSVTGDKATMTEYVTGTSSYVASSPKSLTSPITVSATRSAGSAVVPGVGATAVVGASSTLGAGTGLGTDTYTISLGQPTAITDAALPAGETYHILLTYTLSSTL
jgi:hypothetical protein